MNNVVFKLLKGLRTFESGDLISQADLARASDVSKNTVGKYISVFMNEPAFAELVDIKMYSGRKILVRK